MSASLTDPCVHSGFPDAASPSLPRRPGLGLALALHSKALWCWGKKNELSLPSRATFPRVASAARFGAHRAGLQEKVLG